MEHRPTHKRENYQTPEDQHRRKCDHGYTTFEIHQKPWCMKEIIDKKYLIQTRTLYYAKDLAERMRRHAKLRKTTHRRHIMKDSYTKAVEQVACLFPGGSIHLAIMNQYFIWLLFYTFPLSYPSEICS